ncbi:hypothetical protein GQ43DRAFT_474995 [Delitschia confertaspora ATCC 74209]|uniref:DUF8004 domain-containing protein n=1 Tax=Delitschia confertaspora ATCC 74209 TaxID=1513339 RepID=A0A9P4MP82_9PLEO|nr:hypothetical protein GQ43DRAFT_474995 [Delitschia confertaspora ATCC 74209]
MVMDLLPSPNNGPTDKPLPPLPAVASRRSPFKRLYCSPSRDAKNGGETSASSWGAFDSRPVQEYSQKDVRSVDARPTPSIISQTRSQSRAMEPPTGPIPETKPVNGSRVIRNTTRLRRVKRWDGFMKKITNWDGLRRDPELWFEDGDCLVHLHAPNHSQRGPSFCVPLAALKQLKCKPMFRLSFVQMVPIPSSRNLPYQRPASPYSTPVPKRKVCELYISAPEDVSKDVAFQWHITTRNFFAFLFRKPLVGSHFGITLVELQSRMRLFRSDKVDNFKDFLCYVKDQGYRNYVNCQDYALAMLYYAEHYHLRDVWVDAFVHCVGMNDSLVLSSEFEEISPATKALITRAYLEMDIHLGRVATALSNFLEIDMSPTYLGLSQGTNAHLDRFRSFLYGYYVVKFGYWPPVKERNFSKALYKSMYFDFQNLYDYLVDLESTNSFLTQKPASGGICVLQNLQAFDNRHNFPSLPHPMPLLPQWEVEKQRLSSQKSLKAFKLALLQTKDEQDMTMRAALTSATNAVNALVINSPLVKEYMHFERVCFRSPRDEKISIGEARKVRWLLIYGMLQYLISALRAPKEVRDTEEPPYPLCCLVPERAPWQESNRTADAASSAIMPETSNARGSTTSAREVSGNTQNERPFTTIEPDCATEAYLTHTGSNSSDGTFKQRALRSLSPRRNSAGTKRPPRPFSEIIMHDYKSNLNASTTSPSSLSRSSSKAAHQSEHITASTTRDETRPQYSVCKESRASRPSNLELDTDDFVLEARTSRSGFGMPSVQDISPISSKSSTDIPATWSSASNTSSATSSPITECDDKHDDDAQYGRMESSGLLGGFVTPSNTPLPSSKKSSQFISIVRRLSGSRRSSIASTRSRDFRLSFGYSNGNGEEDGTIHETVRVLSNTHSAPPTSSHQTRGSDSPEKDQMLPRSRSSDVSVAGPSSTKTGKKKEHTENIANGPHPVLSKGSGSKKERRRSFGLGSVLRKRSVRWEDFQEGIC